MKRHPRSKKLILEIPEDLREKAAQLPKSSLRRIVMARLGVDLEDPKIQERMRHSRRRMYWAFHLLHSLKLTDNQIPTLYKMSIRDLKVLAERVEEMRNGIYSEFYKGFVEGKGQLKNIGLAPNPEVLRTDVKTAKIDKAQADRRRKELEKSSDSPAFRDYHEKIHKPR